MAERFEGNGAECMVRFIEDGCRGRIEPVSRKMIFGKEGWEKESIHHIWTIAWLSKPCTYYPPEPVWREVEPWEAYKAVMEKRPVEAQHKESEPGRYSVICLNFRAFDRPKEYQFWVQEE